MPIAPDHVSVPRIHADSWYRHRHLLETRAPYLCSLLHVHITNICIYTKPTRCLCSCNTCLYLTVGLLLYVWIPAKNRWWWELRWKYQTPKNTKTKKLAGSRRGAGTLSLTYIQPCICYSAAMCGPWCRLPGPHRGGVTQGLFISSPHSSSLLCQGSAASNIPELSWHISQLSQHHLLSIVLSLSLSLSTYFPPQPAISVYCSLPSINSVCSSAVRHSGEAIYEGAGGATGVIYYICPLQLIISTYQKGNY